jgi:hypothetical protein
MSKQVRPKHLLAFFFRIGSSKDIKKAKITSSL